MKLMGMLLFVDGDEGDVLAGEWMEARHRNRLTLRGLHQWS